MIEETRTERWKRKIKERIEAAIIFVILMNFIQNIVQPILMDINILSGIVNHSTFGELFYASMLCIFGGVYYCGKDIILR